MFACARTLHSLSKTAANHQTPARLLYLSSPFFSSGNYSMRLFSSGRKAYPRFSVYSPTCVLNLSIIPPRFTISPNNVVSLDNGKKGQGRLMLEWVPRNAEGTFVVENIVRFALGPDEVGLTVDQLPDNEVEFSRITMMGNEVSSTDVMPDKVVRMTPLEGGGVSFKLDFEMNGVGGQTFEKDGAGHITGPFEVVGQRGEVIVMRELMRTSIPALSGWSTMFNIAIENAVNSISGGGGAGGGGGQHGVPF